MRPTIDIPPTLWRDKERLRGDELQYAAKVGSGTQRECYYGATQARAAFCSDIHATLPRTSIRHAADAARC